MNAAKAAADQIQTPNYGHLEKPRPKQDVVPIDIVPDHLPEQNTASQMQQTYLDNSHTIEVTMKDVLIRISNDADPTLLTRTLRILQEISFYSKYLHAAAFSYNAVLDTVLESVLYIFKKTVGSTGKYLIFFPDNIKMSLKLWFQWPETQAAVF